jgi:hypothetical protein
MGYDTITEVVNWRLPMLQQVVECEVDMAEVVGMSVAESKRATALHLTQKLPSPRLIKPPWMPLMQLKKPFLRVVFGILPGPTASTDPMANAPARFVRGVDSTPLRINRDMKDPDADIGNTLIS